MALPRQDAWSADEDIMLAEIVLRHVREGSTQLAAFQEAGEKLSRTAAACGFRWNACIRKKYEAAIELARKHKGNTEKTFASPEKEIEKLVEEDTQTKTSMKKESPNVPAVQKNLEPAKMAEELKNMVSFLRELSDYLEENEAQQAEQLLEKKNELQREKEKLDQELNQVKKDFNRLKEDYKALLEVMEKARALSEGALPYLNEDKEMEESG
ncbi:RsfA family transcriptional regulator [Alteribacillus bidgolensis]|uniref:Prespore-specific regulator n=1 Tax=Alteribacillus bidgolensis TaxID=930129 RepID=A0A1G8G8T2_9BACI|nr:RsfA family transcriptional regulator [Alteribacillus bidgolensis]SDH90701.1 prespore-specific regulator [Alteribacillus bidgolensis]